MFSLASFGFFGGDFGNFLLQLEQLGFFSYLLPFLIIFSLVFGILTRINIFDKNKGINAVISVSVGLMALQFGFVSNFFSELFPRVGIGLSVLLVFMIFLGLFTDPKKKGTTTLFLILGAIGVIWILISSAEFSGSSLGFIINDNAGLIVTLIVVAAAIGLVITTQKENEAGESPFERALRGD